MDKTSRQTTKKSPNSKFGAAVDPIRPIWGVDFGRFGVFLSFWPSQQRILSLKSDPKVDRFLKNTDFRVLKKRVLTLGRSGFVNMWTPFWQMCDTQKEVFLTIFDRFLRVFDKKLLACYEHDFGGENRPFSTKNRKTPFWLNKVPTLCRIWLTEKMEICQNEYSNWWKRWHLSINTMKIEGPF